MQQITIIPGDGIGPEIMEAVVSILEAAKAPLSFQSTDAGTLAFEKTGELLPQETIDSINTNKVCLKSPLTTPVGKGFKSLNVTLRQKFQLFANVRPVRNLPGVPSRYKDVDLVIIRENTEDLYAGQERMIEDGVAESIKRITRTASQKIATHAFQLAKRENRQRVSIAHKANIMKLSDGLFLETCREVAKKYPTTQCDDVIIDACCMQLVRWPESFDIILTQNLYGDILSDLCAGLVGGLGIVPGANIGEDIAIFEAVHGSAPDIAGKNIANPTALLQSAVMMLTHLGMNEVGRNIMTAMTTTLSDQSGRTQDIGGPLGTKEFASAIISNL